MASNLDRFATDLEALITRGDLLYLAMEKECSSKNFEAIVTRLSPESRASASRMIPEFGVEYQAWYSEALALVRQLLPDRVLDFIRHYEKPKGRKQIHFENYRIDDSLQGISVHSGLGKLLVGPSAGLPHLRQQQAILSAAKARFRSSLFDIRLTLQADLFDSELDAASALAANGFDRAAGAMAGVVLERHLIQVCSNHGTTPKKKNPCISDMNDALKSANAIDLPTWRFVQLLGDIRNMCDHAKGPGPSSEQVGELLAGTKKIVKSVY